MPAAFSMNAGAMLPFIPLLLPCSCKKTKFISSMTLLTTTCRSPIALPVPIIDLSTSAAAIQKTTSIGMDTLVRTLAQRLMRTLDHALTHPQPGTNRFFELHNMKKPAGYEQEQ